MNDHDYKVCAAAAAFCLLCAVVFVIVAFVTVPARAAAIVDIAGEKVVIMTADEFIALMRAKDAEIAAAKAKVCI